MTTKVEIQTFPDERAMDFDRARVVVEHGDVVPDARRGEQAAHPGDFIGLFAQMGLHQAIGVFGPQRPQR